METNVNTVEIIQAIIWPVVVFVFFVFFTIFFRQQLRELLQKLIFRFRKGDTELEVLQQAIESKPTKESPSLETTSPSTDESVDADTLLDTTEQKTTDELIDEMGEAFFEGEIEKGEDLYQQIQEMEKDPVEKLKNEGLYQYWQYQRGDVSALGKLKDLSKNPDISNIVHWWLGLCYETSEDYAKAFDEHKIAADTAKSQEKRASYIVSGAGALFHMGEKQKGFQFIMAELANVVDDEAKAILYRGLSNLYEREENHEFRGLALDKAVECRPNHIGVIFDTAYSYSQKGFDELSLLHYKALLRFSPEHKNGLNNIGVAYSRLGMPIKSVEKFLRASDLGNTLASSNLANSYLDAGFAEEASRVIKEAREHENPHRNVGTSFSRISDDKEAEEKREKSIIENAREQQRFLRSFADAYFVEFSGDINLSGMWNSPEWAEIKIAHQENELVAEWIVNDSPRKIKGKITNRAAIMTTYARTYSFSAKESKMSKVGTGKLYYSINDYTARTRETQLR